MAKDELIKAIAAADWNRIGQILDERPGMTRHVVSQLHTSSPEMLENVLQSFQVIAKVIDREKLLDLLRRLMWMLNEESGNNCPAAALAIAHVAMVDPEAVAPHVPSMKVFAEDPSERMRTTVRKALSIIRNARILEL